MNLLFKSLTSQSPHAGPGELQPVVAPVVSEHHQRVPGGKGHQLQHFLEKRSGLLFHPTSFPSRQSVSQQTQPTFQLFASFCFDLCLVFFILELKRFSITFATVKICLIVTFYIMNVFIDRFDRFSSIFHVFWEMLISFTS